MLFTAKLPEQRAHSRHSGKDLLSEQMGIRTQVSQPWLSVPSTNHMVKNQPGKLGVRGCPGGQQRCPVQGHKQRTAVERLLPGSQESWFPSRLCETLDKSVYLSEPQLPSGLHRDNPPAWSGGMDTLTVSCRRACFKNCPKVKLRVWSH